MEYYSIQSCTTATSISPALLFTQLIQTLTTAQCALQNAHPYPSDRTEEILKNKIKFDFIVVGSGTAGSVVASRLSEIHNWQVLLIEKGEDPSISSDIPGFMSTIIHTKEDYYYKVEPDERFCQGMENRQCRWSKGKALGGSSSINAMLYIRGNDRDYNQWGKLISEDWNYENILPYFRKVENYHPDVLKKYGDRFFGTGGPVNIRPYNYSLAETHDIIMKAAEQLKIPIMKMVNMDQYVGFGKAYGTLDGGLRQNAAKAYLRPAKNRNNLYVMKLARVNSVIFNGNKAIGVNVTLKDKRQIELKASKEVILSAGSIATPHILMLSGIGPKQDLEIHNIKVVTDLPVGNNLQDHLVWPGIFLTYINQTSIPISDTLLLDLSYEYLMKHKGDLSNFFGIELVGFINTINKASKYPNIQYHFTHIKQNYAFVIDAYSNLFYTSEKLIQNLKKINQEFDMFILYPTLLNPLSRGKLTLRSSSPDDQIKIYANYLDFQEDIDAFMGALDILRLFTNTRTFKKLGIKLHLVEIPGCEKYATDSRDYWLCNLRHTASTIYHPVGTCKMGSSYNNDSVVDSNLKVHTIKGLRVIDASVMPIITSGNTNAPTFMIAEKGSDLIKKEWIVKDNVENYF